MMQAFIRLLEPLRRRIALMVTRAVVTSVNDVMKLQSVQVKMLSGETREYERLQQYGFSAKPYTGSDALVLCIDGNREHGLVISVDDKRYRLASLEEGAVALYNKDGASVHLKKDGEILVSSGAGDTIEMTKDREIKITAQSKVAIDATVIELGATALEAVLKGESFMTCFNSHMHTGGFTVPTSTPTVQANKLLHLSAKVKAQ
jgi:phage baseplate assembly protein V